MGFNSGFKGLTCDRSAVPGYFTTSVCGTIVWLMLTAGQWPFRRVNFMCDDLDSLTLTFHFFSHFSMMCKCSGRLSLATVGSSWVANIVVSFANVPNVVSLNVGTSDVYRTYRRGPRMLPWGTPEWMWKRLEFSLLNFLFELVFIYVRFQQAERTWG